MNNMPVLLTPAAKDYLWGGNRLNDFFNKNIDIYPLAETWECSTHEDGQSLVDGVPLGEYVSMCPEILGSHVLQITGGKPEIPILVKLIDAKEDLSVQVHPDDEYAQKYEGQYGKAEMWYVLSAYPNTKVVYGFNQDVNADQVRNAIKRGTIDKLLNYIPVKKNDLFFINPGTIHAIGAGSLIVEVQQSSNLTYRLYDYDRIDKKGEKRMLHVDKAMEVVNLKSSVAPRQPMRVFRYRKGCASELLVRCKYFCVESLLLNTETCRNLVSFQTSSNSFHILMCIEGCGSISGKGFMLPFFKGDCVFVPAESIPLKLNGIAQLLNIWC